MKYVKGRNNLSATIFVPYDCQNNCPFCTSKKDYKDCTNFSLEKILNKIKLLNNNPLIKEYVITGGEPLADLEQLTDILSVACAKPVYINTTLPVTSEFEKSIHLINNEDCIKGINVSRHIGYEFPNVATVEDMDRIAKPIRINSVITSLFTWDKFIEFCDKYGKKKRDINLRADYRTITINNLKSRDYISSMLSEFFNYVDTESCMVCNSEYFSVRDSFLCSYHRGLELSSVTFGDKCYVNDIIIKQDGNIYKDWDCIKDSNFEQWITLQ